jgi:hypothetical protein
MSRHIILLFLLGQTVTMGQAGGQEGLDLALDPADVQTDQPAVPPPDLLNGRSTPHSPGPGAPGWRVRPEADVDLETGRDGEASLSDLDLELNSLRLRLQRTW